MNSFRKQRLYSCITLHPSICTSCHLSALFIPIKVYCIPTSHIASLSLSSDKKHRPRNDHFLAIVPRPLARLKPADDTLSSIFLPSLNSRRAAADLQSSATGNLRSPYRPCSRESLGSLFYSVCPFPAAAFAWFSFSSAE